MKRNFSGVGQKAMLGLALAGWLCALQSGGWKMLLPAETVPPPVTGDLSVDGVRLGDEEFKVRSLWGEPSRIESDLMGHFSGGAEKGYRYLRYADSRMVVLREGRVAVVDGGAVGLSGQELPRVGDRRADLERALGATRQVTLQACEVLTYQADQGATLHYALEGERIARVSLSRTGDP